MSDRNTASTLAKGLAVLECFETAHSNLTMADIARLTGLDRAIARRLCLTLESSGYLTRQGKAFALSPKVVVLAGGYMNAQDIGRSVQPVLNTFAEELEGEIALAVRHKLQAVYVARSAVAKARSSLGFSVGSTLPLLHTSVGRMLVAMEPDDTRRFLIENSPVVKYNENTDLDQTSLQAKIDVAAAQGYAFSVNEFELGAVGVGVAIPGKSGPPAVLATSATVNQFDRDGELDRTLDTLRRAAMRLRA